MTVNTFLLLAAVGALLSLATYRLVRLVLFDSITDGLREKLLGETDGGEFRPGLLSGAVAGQVVWLTVVGAVVAGLGAALVMAGIVDGIDEIRQSVPWRLVAFGAAGVVVGEYMLAASYDKGRWWLHDLLSCPWCLGVHVAGWATFAVAVSGVWPLSAWVNVALAAALWFAVAAVAALLALLEGLVDAATDWLDVSTSVNRQQVEQD